VTADRKLSDDAREVDPSEWSSRALTRRLADYLVNAYTDGRGYAPTDLDDVEVTLRDGFDIVLGEMHEAQRDRSDGGGSEDSTTASEYPATAEPPSAPVTASKAARHEAEAYRHEQIKGTAHGLLRAIGDPPPPHLFHPTTALRRLLEDADVTPLPPDGVANDGSPTWQGEPHPPPTHTRGGRP
jgi:hypothetical protein